MNVGAPSASVQNKRLYSFILCELASFLSFSFGILSFLNLNIWVSHSRSPYLEFTQSFFEIIWLAEMTTYLKYINNAIIIKGAFSNQLLTPLKTVQIEPVLKLCRLTLIRVNFALDGIQHGYFSFTNQTGFQMLKKRQAISRVL